MAPHSFLTEPFARLLSGSWGRGYYAGGKEELGDARPRRYEARRWLIGSRLSRSSYQAAPTKIPGYQDCWNTDISRCTCWAEGVSVLGGFVGVRAGADSSRWRLPAQDRLKPIRKAQAAVPAAAVARIAARRLSSRIDGKKRLIASAGGEGAGTGRARRFPTIRGASHSSPRRIH